MWKAGTSYLVDFWNNLNYHALISVFILIVIWCKGVTCSSRHNVCFVRCTHICRVIGPIGMSMIHQFELSLCIKTVVKCEIFFGFVLFCFCFFALVTFYCTSFQGVNLLPKIYKQKNKGVPFCFLPRAPQTLVTPLHQRQTNLVIKQTDYLIDRSLNPVIWKFLMTMNPYMYTSGTTLIHMRTVGHSFWSNHFEPGSY